MVLGLEEISETMRETAKLNKQISFVNIAVALTGISIQGKTDAKTTVKMFKDTLKELETVKLEGE